jgi:hypothetical protein
VQPGVRPRRPGRRRRRRAHGLSIVALAAPNTCTPSICRPRCIDI